MKRITTILVAMLVAFLMGGSWSWATPPGEDGEHKVAICHRTASDTNPYVYIEVDEASLSPGHLDNDDPGHKPRYWKSDGIFRGIEHSAGDPKDDYLAQSPEDCEDNTVVEPEPFVPLATITSECGSGRVEIAWKFGDETDEPQRSDDFVISIDGKVVRSESLRENEDVWFPFDFKEDTGVHTIVVTYDGEVLAEATVQSNCEKPEPKPTPTPTPTPEPTTPDKPDEPKADKPNEPRQPELAATGVSPALAAIAAGLLAAGSGMVWFGRRRLTDQ